jgi:hypothetical protein
LALIKFIIISLTARSLPFCCCGGVIGFGVDDGADFAGVLLWGVLVALGSTYPDLPGLS